MGIGAISVTPSPHDDQTEGPIGLGREGRSTGVIQRINDELTHSRREKRILEKFCGGELAKLIEQGGEDELVQTKQGSAERK